MPAVTANVPGRDTIGSLLGESDQVGNSKRRCNAVSLSLNCPDLYGHSFPSFLVLPVLNDHKIVSSALCAAPGQVRDKIRRSGAIRIHAVGTGEAVLKHHAAQGPGVGENERV